MIRHTVQTYAAADSTHETEGVGKPQSPAKPFGREEWVEHLADFVFGYPAAMVENSQADIGAVG